MFRIEKHPIRHTFSFPSTWSFPLAIDKSSHINHQILQDKPAISWTFMVLSHVRYMRLNPDPFPFSMHVMTFYMGYMRFRSPHIDHLLLAPRFAQSLTWRHSFLAISSRFLHYLFHLRCSSDFPFSHIRSLLSFIKWRYFFECLFSSLISEYKTIPVGIKTIRIENIIVSISSLL